MTIRWSQLLGSLGAAAGGFPLVVAAGLAGMGGALVMNHNPDNQELANQCMRLMWAAVVALPLGVGAGFAVETSSRTTRWLGAAVAMMAVAWIWLTLPLGKWTNPDHYRYTAMITGAVSLAIAVPGARGNDAWWRVNVGLAQAVVLAGFISAIVGLGLHLTMFSVEKLFELDLKKPQSDIFFFSVFIAAPLAVITLMPSTRDKLEPSAAASFWERLCQWVLVPLGLLFITILAAYSAMILFRGELPDGMVATPVLSLGAFGTVAMLLLYPWRDLRPWARLFARIYPVGFLAFSVLLFLAIFERVSTYGMTFPRYSALALGFWFAAAAVIFLMRVRLGSLLIFGLLALAATVAAFGPASAATLSLRSQSERLRTLLQDTAGGMDSDQILSGLKFLNSNFGVAAIEEITGPLGPGLNIVPKWKIPEEVLNRLGLSKGEARKTEWNGAVATEGFRVVYPMTNFTHKLDLGKTADGKPLTIEFRSGTLSVYVGKEKLQELLPAAMEGHNSSPDSPPGPLRVPFTVGDRNFYLVVLLAEIASPPEPRNLLPRFGCLILEK